MRRSAGSVRQGEESETSHDSGGSGGKLAGLYEGILRESGALSAEPEFLDLKNTPARFERMMVEELLSSYRPGALDQLKNTFTTFPVDQRQRRHRGDTPMVVVKDIPYYSLCAHHAIPFYGKAHVGYIPNKVIVGLSKVPRAVKFFASKFQVQERLVDEIADFLVEMLDPVGVIVVMTGVHLCMAMRGVAVAGVDTRTTALRGAATEDQVKSEFYTLITG